MNNQFKEAISNYERKEEGSFQEKERRAISVVQQIYLFYEKVRRGEITDAEKQEFLEIDEEIIPDDISHMLYYVVKTYIETGNIEEFKEYKEKYMKEKEVIPKRRPEELKKASEQRREEAKQEEKEGEEYNDDGR